jgi:hypothetical protein
MTKEEIMMKHCSDNGLLSMHLGKSILAAMTEFELQQAIGFKNWCDAGYADLHDNQEQHSHTNEELYFLFTQNYKSDEFLTDKSK